MDLKERGIDKVQAANLRARFSAFVEDWESSIMEIYNNYDEEVVKLHTR